MCWTLNHYGPYWIINPESSWFVDAFLYIDSWLLDHQEESWLVDAFRAQIHERLFATRFGGQAFVQPSFDTREPASNSRIPGTSISVGAYLRIIEDVARGILTRVVLPKTQGFPGMTLLSSIDVSARKSPTGTTYPMTL